MSTSTTLLTVQTSPIISQFLTGTQPVWPLPRLLVNPLLLIWSSSLNYVLWVQSLLDTTSPDITSDDYDSSREVIGLDIGTGASCIYPLLGTVQRPQWKFVATGTALDVDTGGIEKVAGSIGIV